MKWEHWARWGEGGIIILAIFLRLWGLGYDLPYIFHPDEPLHIRVSLRLLLSGDLNPHFFFYPSLFIYLNALTDALYFLLGRLMGMFKGVHDLHPLVTLVGGTAYAPMPSLVLADRLLTLAASVGTVWVVARLGTYWTGKAEVGLLAALLTAIDPTMVAEGRWVTPNSFVALFATLAVWGAIAIYRTPSWRNYLLTGVAVGLTGATKYNGAWVILPLLAVHLWRYGLGRTRQERGRLYAACAVAALVFLVTSPYFFIDMDAAIPQMRYEAAHYARGHFGMEGRSLEWYVRYMAASGFVIYPVAWWQVIRGIWQRRDEVILLALFPVLYFIFIAGLAVRNARTFMVIEPLLFLLAALFVVEYLSSRGSPLLRSRAALLLSLLMIGSLIGMGYRTVRQSLSLFEVDGREVAAAWIEEHLPHGSTVALEMYAPFVNPEHFHVLLLHADEHPPQWYAEHGVDYLIFSEGAYGRFYADPERYAPYCAIYDAFFEQLPLLKRFDEGRLEIRIYCAAAPCAEVP